MRVAKIARLFLSMCGGLVLWAACATSASRGSGESHFLECNSDANCADAGPKTKCENRHCVVPRTASPDGGPSPDAPDGYPGVRCGPTCHPIQASPVTTCRGYSSDFPNDAWNVACTCDGGPFLYILPACHRRLSDGTAWFFGANNLEDPGAWTACTPDQEAAAAVSCEFARCDTKPNSSCWQGDLCKLIDCGGPEYDVGGCRRKSCATDAECATDERCTLVVVEPMPCTYGFSGSCECSPTAPGIGNMDRFCNSVASVGQRGDWTELEVERVEGPPPHTPGFTWYWRIGADGGLAGSRQGLPVTSALSALDLDRLRLIADGPDFRRVLRDGSIQCNPPPGDVLVTFRLKFGTETLDQIATGCALSGPAGNVFERLYNLVEQY